MPQGTLANLATSAFVRTPPLLAERIVRCLLSFPVGKATMILDPTAGEGDLLLPCQEIPRHGSTASKSAPSVQPSPARDCPRPNWSPAPLRA